MEPELRPPPAQVKQRSGRSSVTRQRNTQPSWARSAKPRWSAKIGFVRAEIGLPRAQPRCSAQWLRFAKSGGPAKLASFVPNRVPRAGPRSFVHGFVRAKSRCSVQLASFVPNRPEDADGRARPSVRVRLVSSPVKQRTANDRDARCSPRSVPNVKGEIQASAGGIAV
jgi:hypothetical protein